MFIAIIFVCITATDCRFIHSPIIESPQMCISILNQQAIKLEANKDKILAWQGQCIKLETATGEI